MYEAALHKTREAWLMALTEGLSPMFEQAGWPIPEKLGVSVGWPSEKALAPKQRVIGQCWPPVYSADSSTQIFISPVLADTIEVGATLVHELVHAAVGCAFGHKGPFKRLALSVGLIGPMRSTRAGEGLRARLNALMSELGPYPHAAMQIRRRARQSTRMLKIECPSCEYTARVAQKWLDVGVPTCPCGTRMIRKP
jgi:hypothetical protein